MRPTVLFTAALSLACALAGAPDLHAAPDTSGFLYGTVLTRSGTEYEGRLRWGDQEAFWGDLFNSSKEDLRWRKEIPRDQRTRRNTIELFGLEIAWRREDSSGRQLIARFGDIDRIEVTGRDDAVLVMKSGHRVEVEGGSNDIGGNAEVTVWDTSLGAVTTPWRNIDRIQFRDSPPDLEVDAHRLYGTVQTEAGEFRGWIQWDQDECLSTDVLDGDTADGDVEIPMGKLRTIERRNRRSSRVALRDGRELVLDGSNDVDSDNRGIFVEDERFGRVLVSWNAFERVDFSEPPGSGPAYDSFPGGGPIQGTVTTRDGRQHTGRLAYDADEEETWELLGGERDGIEYYIPFALVRSVTPRGLDRSRVELTTGETLDLEDSADVGEPNAGIVVLRDDERPTYVPWDEVERVELEG
ncbi:MAG: hypothetical protein ACLF0P_07365 [Thermoanaerobaculia bacterium]